MTRLPITKTPKPYVGGAFIRSESGRVTALHDASGAFFANVPQCTRKDLRNAVEAAAKAGPGWAKRTGYNRGQILYRLAEMLDRGEVVLEIDEQAPSHDISTTETDVKYHGYLRRQQADVERFREDESRPIPRGFPYERIPGLSREMVQRFGEVEPATLGWCYLSDQHAAAAEAILAELQRACAFYKCLGSYPAER